MAQFTRVKLCQIVSTGQKAKNRKTLLLVELWHRRDDDANNGIVSCVYACMCVCVYKIYKISYIIYEDIHVRVYAWSNISLGQILDILPRCLNILEFGNQSQTSKKTTVLHISLRVFFDEQQLTNTFMELECRYLPW